MSGSQSKCVFLALQAPFGIFRLLLNPCAQKAIPFINFLLHPAEPADKADRIKSNLHSSCE